MPHKGWRRQNFATLLPWKIVPEMTYNVSSGTLNPAVPYYEKLH